jgi:hypothetical protein
MAISFVEKLAYINKNAKGDENLLKAVKYGRGIDKIQDEEKKKKVKDLVNKAFMKIKELNTSKTKDPKKKIEAEIEKFKKSIGRTKWLTATRYMTRSGLRKTTIEKDAVLSALPKGKRISRKTGKPYWENRANRTDVKQPPKTYPKLAEGGVIGSGKNGYIAFYKGKRIEVYADTMYQAQQTAAKHFKAKKEFEVNVALAEVDGKQYVQNAYAKGGVVIDTIYYIGLPEITSVDKNGRKSANWKYIVIEKDGTKRESIAKIKFSGDAKDVKANTDNAEYVTQKEFDKLYSEMKFAKGGETRMASDGMRVGRLIDTERVRSYDEMLEEEIVNSFSVKYSDKHDRIVIESEIFKEENDYTLHEGTIHLTEKGLFQLEDILGVLATDIKDSKYAKGGKVEESEWVVNFSSEDGDYKTKFVKARSKSEAINKGFMEISEDGEDSDNYSVGAIYIRKNRYSKDGGYKLVEYAKGGEVSEHESKFEVDDVVYNKKTKTIGIVRMEDDKHGEVKTDADGNVDIDDLEHYNPLKYAHQGKADVAPSTKKEIEERMLWKPFASKKYGHGGTIAEGNYHMILSQAKEVKHHVAELQDILKNQKDIDAWVVAKMENASSTLSDITHYLDGKTEK